MSLEKVLTESDIVTLHAPLNDETQYIISTKQFEMMKESAYLINTARSGLIDTDAMIEALKADEIAGMGIDVYEKEPPEEDLGFFELENVTLSPHLAWCSVEAGWDIRKKIIDDIMRYRDGKPPRFVVNKEIEEVLARGK